MKRRMLGISSVLLLATFLVVGAGPERVKLCHVTNHVVGQTDDGTLRCAGVVVEIAPGIVDDHLAHGDVIPADPDGFAVGQRVEMNCAF